MNPEVTTMNHPPRTMPGRGVDATPDTRVPVIDALDRGGEWRVALSSAALAYTGDGPGGTIVHTAEPEYLDDGHRSRSASGAAQAAAPCSLLATRRATCRCWSSPSTTTSHHSACSFSTTTPTGSSTIRRKPSRALEEAQADRWTVVSIKGDWVTVF
jgi:hypothetical protein